MAWSIAGAIGYFLTIWVAGAVVFGQTWSTVAFFNGAPVGEIWVTRIFTILTHLPFLWVQGALAAKRAHDRSAGASLAVVLTVLVGVFSYVPEGAYMAAGVAADGGSYLGWIMLASGLLSLVISLYLLVVLGFLDGTRGPNRFGPSPKGIGGDMPDATARVFD